MAMQYDRITIRADGLDGRKASQYEATVLGILRSYEQMQTGRSILQAFSFLRREVLINPYDGSGGPCNAVGGVGDWGMFRTKVKFTPSDFFATSPCISAEVVKGGAGWFPQEVLYHELVHAMRHAAGTLDYDTVKSRNNEEALAIMVTNIYSSEINRLLRKDHRSKNALFTSSEHFFTHNGDMIRVLYHQHPDFCRWIAEAVVPFNPLRSYYLTLKGVPRLRTESAAPKWRWTSRPAFP